MAVLHELTFDSSFLQVIAQQMTYLDAACFAAIQPEEMLLSNWTRPNKEEVAPTLTHLARQFNMWSGMVSTDIILANSLNVRRHVYMINPLTPRD